VKPTVSAPALPDKHEEALAIERGNLRSQLAQAALARPEFLRMEKTRLALDNNLWATGGSFLLLPHDECFEAVYGKAGSRRFWEILLSKLMERDSFLDILALTGADSGSQYKSLRLALVAALRDAFDMEEKWLVRGDTFDDTRLRIIPRLAAEWLLRNPLFCHLVPPSLAAFLERRAAPSDVDQHPERQEHQIEHEISAQPVIYATGAPGRPSSMQLVEREMDQRAAAGTMITTSMAKESAALSAWLKTEHPLAPRLTPKSIQNTQATKWRGLGGQSIPKSIPKRNEGG
jgi:hypothetical protein